ncbi:MAG: YicC/YloC family endoribonuclease [Planctomycetota bacterium]
MTGYGAASVHADGASYHVELRTVNNRYLKFSLRLEDSLQALETDIELALRKSLARGTVSVRVAVSESEENSALEVNEAALARYVDAASRAAKADGGATVDVAALMTLPGVLRVPTDETARLERVRGQLLPLFSKACGELVAMRAREGASLAADLASHLDLISDRLTKIEARAPQVVAGYEQRLKTRIEALLTDAGAQVEQADLVREIAVYAERTDIAEEVVRLRTHIEQFRKLVDGSGGEAVGRTLDFLGQELLREANTIASKSPDAEVSALAIEIKGAIDRIKEQVQNVE